MTKNRKNMTFMILDDHPLVCAAIESMLKKNSGDNSTIFSVNNVKDGMKILKQEEIDLMILDVNLANSDGFEFLRCAHSHGFQGKTLFISATENQLYSETAFKLGADGYIAKSEEISLICDTINSILNGCKFFKLQLNKKSRNNEVSLSKRETVVFNYLMKGYTNKEIAEILSLSAKTISTYKSRMLEKYQVNSIVELVKMKNNLLKSE